MAAHLAVSAEQVLQISGSSRGRKATNPEIPTTAAATCAKGSSGQNLNV